MADHPYGRDSLDHGLGIRLALAGDIICADRRHSWRIHRRGARHWPLDHRIRSSRRSLGYDGRGHRFNAGRCGAFRVNLAAADLSVALATALYGGVKDFSSTFDGISL